MLLKPIPISPIPEYMAGEDGRIYIRRKGRRAIGWKPLRGYKNDKGYLSVSMYHKKKRVTRYIHRLVCMAFHGMPESEELQVRHLDGNPQNNRPTNLKWGTSLENWQDRKAHGHGMEGEKHWAAKLTDIERGHIRWAVQRGLCSQRHVARMLRMSQGSIAAILTD